MIHHIESGFFKMLADKDEINDLAIQQFYEDNNCVMMIYSYQVLGSQNGGHYLCCAKTERQYTW